MGPGRAASPETSTWRGCPTANRYSYVNGDPINKIDPTGHVGECGPDNVYCGGLGAGSYSVPQTRTRTKENPTGQGRLPTTPEEALEFMLRDFRAASIYNLIDRAYRRGGADGNWSSEDLDAAAQRYVIDALLRADGIDYRVRSRIIAHRGLRNQPIEPPRNPGRFRFRIPAPS